MRSGPAALQPPPYLHAHSSHHWHGSSSPFVDIMLTVAFNFDTPPGETNHVSSEATGAQLDELREMP